MGQAMRSRNIPGVAAGLVLSLVAGLTGCYVKVNKGQNGDKDVTVRMPMGGVQVHENTPSANDLGLPTYPGATVAHDEHGSSGADINLGFGEWQLHVKVAKYETADPQGRVETFYRSALGRYGDVIECRGGHAVGSPARTRDGLGCEDQHPGSKGIHIGDEEMSFDLRAGSKRHQHIVGFSPDKASGTHFALLRLDLPQGTDEGKQE